MVALRKDETRYSDMIGGERSNYNWAVRFDVSGTGHVGINQYDGDQLKDRVLLSNEQVDELLAFIRQYRPR